MAKNLCEIAPLDDRQLPVDLAAHGLDSFS